jgi:hypothetical protein
MNKDWVKRRWLDLRNGHSVYLIFFIQFAQFIVVTYGLYITENQYLRELFPSIAHWMAFFLLTYVPAAIAVGHTHLKKQVPTETKQMAQVNPYLFESTPGKEQLYSLPANRVSYNIQMKGMQIQNEIVDALEQITGRNLTKWAKADFDQVLQLREITERLEHGENIVDIRKDKKL